MLNWSNSQLAVGGKIKVFKSDVISHVCAQIPLQVPKSNEHCWITES